MTELINSEGQKTVKPYSPCKVVGL